MLTKEYTQSQFDPCLFTKFSEGDFIFVLVYIDDIITVFPQKGRLRDEWAGLFCGLPMD